MSEREFEPAEQPVECWGWLELAVVFVVFVWFVWWSLPPALAGALEIFDEAITVTASADAPRQPEPSPPTVPFKRACV